MATKIYKIALASSGELKADREEIRAFVSVKNDTLVKKGIYLELFQWEYTLDAMSRTRLQDEYNKEIAGCDVLLSLFHTKAGEYTREEFEAAWHAFKHTGKPKIFTYFKTGDVNLDELPTEDFLSLRDFQDRLKELGHFWTRYKDINDLKVQFGRQLELLLDKWAQTKEGRQADRSQTEPKKEGDSQLKDQLNEVKNLLVKGYWDEAFSRLRGIQMDGKLKNELMQIQTAYEELKRQQRVGVINFRENNQQRNIIMDQLLSLIDEIGREETMPYNFAVPHNPDSPYDRWNLSGTSDTQQDPTQTPPKDAQPASDQAPSSPKPSPNHIFISHAPEDLSYLEELKRQLRVFSRSNPITVWDKTQIKIGDIKEKVIQEKLNTSGIILLMVSADYMANDDIWEGEVVKAMEKSDGSLARVIPVILKPSDWRGTPFGKLRAVPSHKEAISQYAQRSEAWLEVVEGIKQLLG